MRSWGVAGDLPLFTVLSTPQCGVREVPLKECGIVNVLAFVLWFSNGLYSLSDCKRRIEHAVGTLMRPFVVFIRLHHALQK